MVNYLVTLQHNLLATTTMIGFCKDVLGLEEGYQLWPSLQQVSQDGVEGQLKVQGGRDAKEENGSVDVLLVILLDKKWFADTGEEMFGILEDFSRGHKISVLGMH